MKKVKNLPSKIVQIATAPIAAGPNNGQYVELFALCEDGSLWRQYRSNGTANVPSDDEWYSVCLIQPGSHDEECFFAYNTSCRRHNNNLLEMRVARLEKELAELKESIRKPDFKVMP